ncbi:MAG: N-acetylmuramic acid 6-phosphate etherase [Chloroflexi bacterium AL-W]|nr:N-acetylmuramic acid 6-phosphate etherase [Chloroflexi bacterium AL-N1]NOK66057.1 N-acetylmuramic acid 6-phosphate etherase [Chloroflexi bacterium AL-N10]NOK72938.1 N-acetylmuramic acid 6-phosphate etherase [Chloroflexi bacterium AL-N5]NOK79835.1 N-acetylmuramic acid 6-phosphate etherase [Chloroflexi bacterium AL-W]
MLTTSITETINPATQNIDMLPTRAIVAAITAEDAKVAPAVAAVGEAIAQLADIVVERMQDGGRLIYIGAGTSGRLGTLDAAELPPTFSADPNRVIALIAGGSEALIRAVEAVEDNHEQVQRDLAAVNVGPKDVVVGLAASGTTPYVVSGMVEAKKHGAFVAGIACTTPSPLEDAVNLMITPIVGPEVITGSTRMKAGTAQKLVLNTLSTTVMIQMGKTFGNLMVDLQPKNEKLRRRMINIVMTATGVEREEAQQLLQEAGDETKTAIVMVLAGIDANTARHRLAENNGRVRDALHSNE